MLVHMTDDYRKLTFSVMSRTLSRSCRDDLCNSGLWGPRGINPLISWTWIYSTTTTTVQMIMCSSTVVAA